MEKTPLTVLWMFICLGVIGCNSTTVRTTEREAVVIESVPIPEDQLLDVGVGIFNPGISTIGKDQPGVYPRIREAEARFMSYQLAQTIQNSGSWGVVRVIPDRLSEMDVWIDATILKSDGATLELEVSARDSTGKSWYTKRYSGDASKYSYDSTLARREEPFQGVYNQITNDMLAYHRKLAPDQIRTIRVVSELKFAKQFSPEAYSKHLAADDKGYLYITRLPAENDPILQRIKQMRERDYMFVDTLQEYYASFVRQMGEPYMEWRRAFYEEDAALRQVKAEANRRLIGGILAVAAGILAQGTGSNTARAAGQVGIGAGAAAIYSGLNKREEAKVHAEALEEISNSMRAEMEPHAMQLEDRTVTLSGSVNEQYSQWRQILKEMYDRETGQLSSVPTATTDASYE